MCRWIVLGVLLLMLGACAAISPATATELRSVVDGLLGQGAIDSATAEAFRGLIQIAETPPWQSWIFEAGQTLGTAALTYFGVNAARNRKPLGSRPGIAALADQVAAALQARAAGRP